MPLTTLPPLEAPPPDSPRRVRRWTLMLVPHGSEALRSWSVSERALRAVAWGGTLVAAVLFIGLGTIFGQLSRLATSPAEAATLSGDDPTAGDVDSLRARVANLDQALTTIRAAEGRLRLVAGSGAESAASDSVALLLRAEADSLLRLAGRVTKGYGTLADSASRSPRRARGASGHASR